MLSGGRCRGEPRCFFTSVAVVAVPMKYPERG